MISVLNLSEDPLDLIWFTDCKLLEDITNLDDLFDLIIIAIFNLTLNFIVLVPRFPTIFLLLIQMIRLLKF